MAGLFFDYRDKKCTQSLVDKKHLVIASLRPRNRSDNTKINLEERLVEFGQDCVQWRALVSLTSATKQ
jgi:hypothetical protein